MMNCEKQKLASEMVYTNASLVGIGICGQMIRFAEFAEGFSPLNNQSYPVRMLPKRVQHRDWENATHCIRSFLLNSKEVKQHGNIVPIDGDTGSRPVQTTKPLEMAVFLLHAFIVVGSTQ